MTTTILDRRPEASPEAELELAGEQRLATVTVLRSTPRPRRRRAAAVPHRFIPRAPARCPAPRPQHGLTDPAPVRLTKRGQAALVVTVLAVAVLALVTVVAGALGRMAGPAESGDPASSRTVVVRPGDTLWDIATAAAPSADPRSTINLIEELNGLDAGDGVRPGLRLVVPRG